MGDLTFTQRVYRISNFSERVNGTFFCPSTSALLLNRIMQMTCEVVCRSVRQGHDHADARPHCLPPETNITRHRDGAKNCGMHCCLYAGRSSSFSKEARPVESAVMQRLLNWRNRQGGGGGGGGGGAQGSPTWRKATCDPCLLPSHAHIGPRGALRPAHVGDPVRPICTTHIHAASIDSASR